MREFFKLDAISYCLLHCVYMQTSRCCQKSMRRQRESKQHGSNLIDQLRIRRGRNDGCLRTVKDGRGKRRGWRKRVRGRRRITYPAGRTDYKKKKKKRGRGGQSKAHPGAFFVYCRIFQWFQSRMSHLSPSLFRTLLRPSVRISLFSFRMYACQLAALDSRDPRERIETISLEKTLVCAEIILPS